MVIIGATVKVRYSSTSTTVPTLTGTTVRVRTSTTAATVPFQTPCMCMLFFQAFVLTVILLRPQVKLSLHSAKILKAVRMSLRCHEHTSHQTLKASEKQDSPSSPTTSVASPAVFPILSCLASVTGFYFLFWFQKIHIAQRRRLANHYAEAAQIPLVLITALWQACWGNYTATAGALPGGGFLRLF